VTQNPTTDVGRILVIEDEPRLRAILKMQLETAKDARYEVRTAEDGLKGLEEVRRDPPDLILLDVMMPGMDGYDVCKRLKSDPLTSRIPIIFLTAKSNLEDRLQGLESFADDYVTKPWEHLELLFCVRNQLKTRRAQLQSNALTGLPGNVLIETELSRRIAAREKFAFLHLDLDYFKSFNDYYGYARGDLLIRFTASLLHEVLEREGGDRDFVGHIGGDDFVIITVPDRAMAVAETIRAEFDRRVADQYDTPDRERGFITVHSSRQGGVQNFEFLSITVLVVTNVQRDIQHSAQVADVAKELKKIGKATKGSCVISDRRSDGTPVVPLRGTPGPEGTEP
jgi:diguanylate cyclase (GGDEF)-like protein